MVGHLSLKTIILGNTAGEALVRHQDTKIISFTGSTVIGKRIASIAAPMMKRLRYIPKQYISATVIIISPPFNICMLSILSNLV